MSFWRENCLLGFQLFFEGFNLTLNLTLNQCDQNWWHWWRYYKSLGMTILKVSFSICQKSNQVWHFIAFGQIIAVINGPILNKYSSYLVTLLPSWKTKLGKIVKLEVPVFEKKISRTIFHRKLFQSNSKRTFWFKKVFGKITFKFQFWIRLSLNVSFKWFFPNFCRKKSRLKRLKLLSLKTTRSVWLWVWLDSNPGPTVSEAKLCQPSNWRWWTFGQSYWLKALS